MSGLRISATTLDSYRLWRDPEQEWMPEEDLRDTILNVWKPNPKVELGLAFGKVLENPDAYLVQGGFRCNGYEFGLDVMEPCLALMDRSGVYEAKGTKEYDGHTVVAKADQIVGARIVEHKTTLSSFDVTKYLDAYQWRFMADIFQPAFITYHVFCLSQAFNDVIELRSIETFNVFPYAALHEDCRSLVREFVGYVTARGLDGVLRQRAIEAA